MGSDRRNLTPQEIYQRCNVLGRQAHCSFEGAMIYVDGKFYDAGMLEIVPPVSWRYATADEIERSMGEQKLIPISGFDGSGP